MDCTCPTPFTEDDVMCRACEAGEIELYLRLDADRIPQGAAWDDYARRQG